MRSPVKPLPFPTTPFPPAAGTADAGPEGDPPGPRRRHGEPVRTRKRRGPGRGGGAAVFLFLVLLFAAGGTVYWFLLREARTEGKAAPGTSIAASVTTALDAPVPSAAGIPVDADGPLPDVTFERPAYAGATWIETWDTVTLVGGKPETEHFELTAAVDYDRALAQLDGGGRMAVDGQPQTIVASAQSLYTEGLVFGQPWTRQPRSSADAVTPLMDRSYLGLYQDVVTPTVREQATNVVQTIETLGDLTVTTYTFDLDVRELGGVGGADVVDPNGLLTDVPNAYVGDVRISIDEQGLVRLLEYRLDAGVVNAAVSAGTDGSSVRAVGTREIQSLSDVPLDIQIPPNVVDAAG